MRFRGKGPVFALISMDALLSPEFDKLSKSAVKLLLYLHGICYGGPSKLRPQDVSQYDLGVLLGCSTKTVSRAVSELEKANYLTVVREFDGFQNRKVNVYNLTGNSLPYHRTNLSDDGAQNRTSLSETRGTCPGDKLVPHTKETDLLTDRCIDTKHKMSDSENLFYIDLLEHLVNEIGHQDTNIWFRGCEIEITDTALILHVPNAYYSRWIMDNYLDSIVSFLEFRELSALEVLTAPELQPPGETSPS